MLHGHIVEMIDACLERLHAARRLLTPSRGSLALDDLLEVSAKQTAEPKKKVRPAIRNKKIRRDAQTASLFSEAPELEAYAPVPFPAVIATQAAKPALVETLVEAIAIQPEPAPQAEPRSISSSPRRKAAVLPSALVHHVPAQPVFISAAQVRKESTQKQSESPAAKAAASKPATAPLTAELLARRWIQSADL